MPLAPLVGLPGANFDARRFTWLGSMAHDVTLCVTSDRSGIRTWDDALKTGFTVGGEGNGSDPDVFANVARNVFHEDEADHRLSRHRRHDAGDRARRAGRLLRRVVQHGDRALAGSDP
jgi:hypothetical protein